MLTFFSISFNDFWKKIYFKINYFHNIINFGSIIRWVKYFTLLLCLPYDRHSLSHSLVVRKNLKKKKKTFKATVKTCSKIPSIHETKQIDKSMPIEVMVVL